MPEVEDIHGLTNIMGYWKVFFFGMHEMTEAEMICLSHSPQCLCIMCPPHSINLAMSQ